MSAKFCVAVIINFRSFFSESQLGERECGLSKQAKIVCYINDLCYTIAGRQGGQFPWLVWEKKQFRLLWATIRSKERGSEPNTTCHSGAIIMSIFIFCICIHHTLSAPRWATDAAGLFVKIWHQHYVNMWLPSIRCHQKKLKQSH